MKASRQAIGRAVDQPGRDVRFYLFHGPDEAQSRALGGRLVQALGASRFLLSSSTIKADPAFKGFDLLRITRLSVVPVPDAMWKRIEELSRGDA